MKWLISFAVFHISALLAMILGYKIKGTKNKMEKTVFYTPLMEGLTIRESHIHGLGLFATKPIEAKTVLGVSHKFDERFQNNYIRTPLGGFINHSDEPNLVLIDNEAEGLLKDLKYVRTIRDIQAGEELTLKYTLYNVCGGTDFDTKGACVDMI